jgi:hypothetical protein
MNLETLLQMSTISTLQTPHLQVAYSYVEV